MYYLIILFVVILDRLTKMAAAGGLVPGESIPVIENIFHITYVQNTGAAFSLLEGQRAFLIVLPAILIVAVIVFLAWKCKEEHWSLKLALALIAAGGLGNLIDRLIYGYVVDFLDFRVWPVFNVADIAVCAGCGLLLLYVIVFDRKHRGETKNEEEQL